MCDDRFQPIDVSDEEYKGTTNSLPHPVLVLKQKSQLENNSYQITVKNFVGSTVFSGKTIFYVQFCLNIRILYLYKKIIYFVFHFLELEKEEVCIKEGIKYNSKIAFKRKLVFLYKGKI